LFIVVHVKLLTQSPFIHTNNILTFWINSTKLVRQSVYSGNSEK